MILDRVGRLVRQAVLLLGFLVLAAAFLVFRAVLPKRSLG